MIAYGAFQMNFESYACPVPGPGNVLGPDGEAQPTSAIYGLMWVGVEGEDPSAFAIGEPCASPAVQERYMKAFMRDFCQVAFGETPVTMVTIPMGRPSDKFTN